MIYLGIDLGTTFSLVAHVNAHGVPTLFPDFHDASEFRTPSVVHVSEEGALVGSTLERLLEDQPGLPHVRFVKLTMGETSGIFTDHLHRQWRPESLSGLILRKLFRDVHAFATEEVGGTVITVPTNFNDAQRRATKQAAVLANLPDPLLIEEPIAAATYYGFSAGRQEQTLFVYDFGGGTFDATILQAAPDGLFVIATEGHSDLGGKNIDEAIMGCVVQAHQQQHGLNPMGDLVAAHQIRQFAVDVKLSLSKPGKGQVRKTLLIAGRTTEFTMTRSQFDELAAPIVDRTILVSERCLQSAGLSWATIDRILLTGGSSLLPLVHRRIAEISQKPADAIVSKQPHQAVAFGAALIARDRFQKSRDGTDQKLVPVSAYNLGISVHDKTAGQPTVRVLIKRHVPLPAQQSQTFYTNRADQTRMLIEVVQTRVLASGESEESSLGKFAFGPIKKPKLNYPVEIALRYDTDGLVRVTAKDHNTGEAIEQILGGNADSLDPELARQREWVISARVNE